MHSAVSGAALVAQSLFAALFPSDCRLCGAPLESISRLPVCSVCLGAIRPTSARACEICGENLPVHSPASICQPCADEKPYFAQAVAYGAYDGELRELIHLLKYDRILPAAGFLGGLLAEAIAKLPADSQTAVIVPVPLHASRRRDRGFNQAELIAKAALKGMRSSPLELAAGALERGRETISQIGLTRPQRNQNIRGAFRVAHLNRVAGRVVVLADDVMTTGTTASECSRVLLKAGARKVYVVTVARTLKMSNAGFEAPQLEIAAHAS